MLASNKTQHLRELQQRHRAAKKCIARLREKIKIITKESGGVILDPTVTDDLISVVHAEVISKYPRGSFLHVFWEQQLQAAKKSSHGMCWHPLMIRWCIYLLELTIS